MHTIRTLLVTAAVTAFALASITTPALAGKYREPKPIIDLYTPVIGTGHVDGAQTSHVAGVFDGDPFGGPYVATYTPDDGTLPAAGTCEPATATLELDGPRTRFLSLTATGKVCGEYGQAGNGPWHTFTGRYLVVDSSPGRYTGTDGFLQLLVTAEGRGNGFAIDT